LPCAGPVGTRLPRAAGQFPMTYESDAVRVWTPIPGTGPPCVPRPTILLHQRQRSGSVAGRTPRYARPQPAAAAGLSVASRPASHPVPTENPPAVRLRAHRSRSPCPPAPAAFHRSAEFQLWTSGPHGPTLGTSAAPGRSSVCTNSSSNAAFRSHAAPRRCPATPPPAFRRSTRSLPVFGPRCPALRRSPEPHSSISRRSIAVGHHEAQDLSTSLFHGPPSHADLGQEAGSPALGGQTPSNPTFSPAGGPAGGSPSQLASGSYR